MHFKEKFTTFNVEVQLKLKVIVVNGSKSYFGVILLMQSFLQGLHVPGRTATQKTRICQVSKVVIRCVGTFLLFYIV